MTRRARLERPRHANRDRLEPLVLGRFRHPRDVIGWRWDAFLLAETVLVLFTALYLLAEANAGTLT